MARPGIMLYFDILEPIRVLPDADKGRLLVAMLEYGQTGTVPVFDGMLALAWGFVKPNLDRDEEAYEKAKVQRSYAAFCKQRKILKRPKVPFEEWSNMTEDERERLITEDNEPERAVDFVGSRYPTTTSTTTPSSTPNSTTATAAAATTNTNAPEFAAATNRESEARFIGGTLGKGVVLLHDDQVGDLLDRMGVDAFDYYVDKLSSFIIKNDAKVKNHYETLLKWWQEDSAVPKTETVPNGAYGKLGKAELEAIQRNMGEE